MAIYRFRVTFEDYEDVYRDIDMVSKSTFLDLHEAIHKSTGYPTDASSSFYVSNDQWKKGTEIALAPAKRKIDSGVLLMEDIRLSKFIDDPHQKFYYIYNFERPYDFHVELIKILKEEGKEYPSIFKSVGQAPRLIAAANFPTSSDDDDDDEDIIEDDGAEEYGVDAEDDYSLMEDDDEEDSEQGEEDNNEFNSGDEDYE